MTNDNSYFELAMPKTESNREPYIAVEGTLDGNRDRFEDWSKELATQKPIIRNYSPTVVYDQSGNDTVIRFGATKLSGGPGRTENSHVYFRTESETPFDHLREVEDQLFPDALEDLEGRGQVPAGVAHSSHYPTHEINEEAELYRWGDSDENRFEPSDIEVVIEDSTYYGNALALLEQLSQPEMDSEMDQLAVTSDSYMLPYLSDIGCEFVIMTDDDVSGQFTDDLDYRARRIDRGQSFWDMPEEWDKFGGPKFDGVPNPRNQVNEESHEEKDNDTESGAFSRIRSLFE